MRQPVLPKPFQDWILRTVEMTVLTLSINHHFDQLLANISPDGLQKLIAKCPTWFTSYDLPYAEMALNFAESSQLPEFQDDFDFGAHQDNPLEYLYRDGKDQALAHIKRMQEVPSSPYELDDSLSDAEFERIGQALAMMRAVTNNARSLAFYGQPISDFIQAGMNGNDEGYIRAATIDPTIEAHPEVAARVAKSILNPHDDFAKKLRTAAAHGPSKNIQKDHHQLRIALQYLYSVGILQQLSDEQRYQLLCEDLNLYDIAGANPKAALCTFIDRWEKSRIL